MTNKRGTIETHARLIEAIAATMTDNDWADNIIYECNIIKNAADKIIETVSQRLAGER